MVSHIDILKDRAAFRAALINRFKWFIHVTPLENLTATRLQGLLPRRDAQAPREVLSELGGSADHILCLHPLGAKLSPRGTRPPPFVSLAVAADDLPQTLGLDWSYSWPVVEGRMNLYQAANPIDFALGIVTEFGSVVSYQAIEPPKLRICCKRSAPADPLSWAPLTTTADVDVIRHE